MMPMGPGPHFPPDSCRSRVLGLLPRGFPVVICGGFMGSALEFLPLWVVFTVFLAWTITRVHFLYVFCKFICSLGVDLY